ncbi:hypothetical protein [Stakelama marina]|uniref:Uncharacterized protein n=1 Tax=Stakelama marina TaxID=2826939 RepID=A0A8T4IDZ3_9SPHN|nr:hypothetical protein [Stakelama marina]MBR0553238.1 hypothetical protein [Stakelama marina]
MRNEKVTVSGLVPRNLWRDAIAALAIAALLMTIWTIRGWPQLAFLNLPDNDDMMRLAQIRDWLAGQGFNDWTQYRLAPPLGAPMHWSRINDIVPTGIIVLTRPLLGTHHAELLAVISYPGMLFGIYLFLSARIGRRLGGAAAGTVALIVAAIAYPAGSLFLPGRIDHHALQIVLTLGIVLSLTWRSSLASGAIAGAGVALSMGIGLETAPQVAAVMLTLFGMWVWRGSEEKARAIGFGAMLVAVTGLLLAFARPTLWTTQWCDTFTPASTTSTLAVGGYWLLLGFAGVRLRGWRARIIAGSALGAVAALVLVGLYPICLSGPYGPMDPFVRHAFMDNVLEARGLFHQELLGIAIPSAGMMAASTIAAIWFLYRFPCRRIVALPLIAILAMSDLVLFDQVRGAYIGSAVAAPLLAQMILAARRGGRTPQIIASWLASCGMVYLLVPAIAAKAFAPQIRATYLVNKGCKSGDVWHQLDRYPAGVVMAPIDMGAYIIGGSHHASVAAGYHRNNRGNRAMYEFFLSQPKQAERMVARWHVRYIAICPTDFLELDVRNAYPDSLAALLLSGNVPSWVERLPLRDTGLAFYRVREGAGASKRADMAETAF